MKLIESEISTLSTSLPFRKRTTLRDESVKVMKLYLATYKNELLNAMNLKADSERSVEDMEAYLKAQDGAEAKLQEATQLFNKAQYRFASDYKLALVDAEGDLFNTVELISKVNKYSRKVFLVFFRISKANELFMAALNEQDAVKMENNRVDLANACKLGKYQLQTIGPFDGDSEYNETVKKLINFTGDLADNKYKSLVEIMDKSGPMTQEDVDEYNSVINIYNEKYIPLINDFNDAGNNFMKRNIPSGS